MTARVLSDGTHGISVNSRIQVRDQERSPIAAHIKRILRERSRAGLRTFALTADVAEAHRQVPIDRRDLHLLGSQVRPGGKVYVNTVGTFGVASASYYWPRIGSALGRLTHYLSGDTAQSWHLLVADDFHLDAGGGSYREALLSFFILCALSGVPLPWSKTAGEDKVAWLGFEILHRSYSLGISARQAEWFVRWTRDMASRPVVNMDNFEGRSGKNNVRSGSFRIRETVSSAAVHIPQCPPTQFHQKVTFLCCVHSKTPVDSGEGETLLVCDADSSDRHLFQSGRTSKRNKDGNWRMDTGSYRARSSLSLALTLLQCGDHTRSLALGVREGRQALSDHLDAGSISGACVLEDVLRRTTSVG